MEILLFPFDLLRGAIGSVGSLAAYVAPFWAFGSIASLPQASWRRTGRSKWGWLTAATLGVWNPIIGVPTAIAHAIGPRRAVKREAELTAAISR